MELSCDRTTATPRPTLSAEAPVFRQSRDAAVTARARIEDAAELYTDDDYWSLNIWDIATMIRIIKLFTIRDEQGESVMKQEYSVIVRWRDFITGDQPKAGHRS